MLLLLLLCGIQTGVSLSPQQPPQSRGRQVERREATRVRTEEIKIRTTAPAEQKVQKKPMALSRLEALPKQTVWTEFGALAAELGPKACNLGQGFPDWAPPPFATEALFNVAQPESAVSAHQYTRSAGLPALCEVLARRYSRHLDRDIDAASEIAVTVGATQALLISLMCIIEAPGDEVVLLEPCFDLYWGQVRLAGGEPKAVPLRADIDHGLSLDLPALRQALFQAKALVVNSPHNPSGKVFTQSELEAIAALVVDENERRASLVGTTSPLYLISDEVYKYVVHSPSANHVHLASLRGIQDVTLTVSSAGKTFSATGWQIGWIVGPRPLIKHAQRILPYLQFCAATPVQTALAKALDAADLPYRGFDTYYDWLRSEYARKQDILLQALNHADLPTLPASGGFFLLADVQAYIDSIPLHYFHSDQGSVSSDWAFCRWLARDFGIIAIPASPFFDAAKPPTDDPGLSQRLVRFAFCKSDDVLHDAASRLQRLRSTSVTAASAAANS